MVANFFKKIFGTRNERMLAAMAPVVQKIGALEPAVTALADHELKAKAEDVRRRLGEGEALDDLRVEAFAVVREASRRTLGLRPFDEQLIGGMVLHRGMIAEMKTGEGKTLM